MRAGKRQRWQFVALALIAVAGSARADYKDSYSHGLEAYKDGRYAEARQLMQQALDEHAEPAAKIRFYGQVFGPYLPQHYAGMAAFKLGDCAAALAQWNSAANRQIAAQLPEIGSEQQRDSADCEQKVAKKDEKSTKPQAGAPESAPPQTPVAEKPPVKTTVAENTPPKPAATPAKPPPPAEKPVAAARNAPPEPLVQAFDNYLAGRYAEVARINPDAYADPRSRFHAYLVRAASKYTLARMSADETMLKGAEADAAAARTLDTRSIPDAALFSPAFRTFYQDSH
ncbi:MAG: hypothetical protein P4L92_13335 [Rudaea sp.]|nr:hypothetical protein [Rudaea sp.]